MSLNITRLIPGGLFTALTASVMAQPITPVPAFSDSAPAALPGANWITNGGNTNNQHYSTPAQINRFAPAAGPGPRTLGSIPLELVASLDNGSTVYDNACIACHGETGEGGHGGGPALTNTSLSLSQIMLIVNDGRNTMPAFYVLSDQELLDISTFVKDSL